MDYFTLILGVIGLLVAMWVPLTSGEGGVEFKRILAWFVICVTTLLIPTALIIWGVMQLSAHIFAPTAVDIPSFVVQIAWSVGVFSGLYILIWGVKFYPGLESWLSKHLSSSPTSEGGKGH